MKNIRLHRGDCRRWMQRFADQIARGEREPFDSCVTDPPYHLVSIVRRFGKPGSAPAKSNGASGVYGRASAGFMGQKWDGLGDDGRGVAFDPETWALVAACLKPGAHLAAFGSPRGYHRMACAIEDAGFEIRDSLLWLFGSGFPKSHNMKGDWQGWGTALKPAYEPIVFARLPLSEGSVAANVLAHGTGALNVDGCRVRTDEDCRRSINAGGGHLESWRTGKNDCITGGHQAGRWPANVIHDGSEEVVAAFPSEAGAQRPVSGQEGSAPTDAVYGQRGRVPGAFHGDAGSAARFFYSAKADAEDRWGSRHPTVKPVELMRWLVRLVTPPGGQVLEPFAGSGTTGVAAFAEGMGCALIERDAKWCRDIGNRLAFYRGGGRTRMEALAKRRPAKESDVPPLFAGLGGDAA